MIQINLIPDVKQQYLKARQDRRFAISISILVMIGAGSLVVVLGLLWAGQGVYSGFIQSGINKQFAALSEVKNVNDLVTIQNQLNRIDDINANKTMNSRLFSILQIVNPDTDSVKFTSIKLSPDEKTILIEGIARKGFASVEVLKKTLLNTNFEYLKDGKEFNDPIATEVVVGDSTYSEGNTGERVARFELAMKYADDLFLNGIKNIQIIGPKGRMDLTDSSLRMPDSLFANPLEDKDEQ